MKHILFATAFLLFLGASAQDVKKVWVFFTDKNGVDFNPYEYFDSKAIENRILNNVPVYHITDYPLNQSYVSNVLTIVDSIKVETRWFNAVVCYATDEDILQLEVLPFVKEVYVSQNNIQPNLAGFKADLNSSDFENLSESNQYLLNRQTEIMGREYFEDKKIDGSGVRVAVFDAGFPKVNESPWFAHIRRDNRIISTYDFVKQNENVYDYSSHGTMVLSCIAGMKDGKKIGLATGAEFLLARTENAAVEPFSEEENWLAAAEWADKNGAQVINSSLGYTKDRYFYSDMDGTSFVSKAANMAASKGILVVNAAGNEGDGKWNFIGAPADADSVLSVGGIDPQTETKVDFSSFGPTYDGRMKPNVSAFAWTIAEGDHGLEKVPGTSFASPLTCGFAACARQAFPDLKTMDLFAKIEESGSLYPYYDYGHGYGIPNAQKLYEGRGRGVITFSLEEKENYYVFKNNSSDKCGENLVYFHIADESGKISYWSVKEAKAEEFRLMEVDDLESGEVLKVFFNGMMIEIRK